MIALALVACSDYALDKHEVEPAVPEPDIVVEPAELEWPTTAVGCVEEQSVVVYNVGEGPLTLSATAVEGPGGWSSEMRTDTIPPGESITFIVRFEPTDIGEASGDVVVRSDDPDQPEVLVPTVGRAADAGTVTDVFRQEAEPVDVLWVIDNSSSMATEQTRVTTAITAFFSWFDSLNLDYHMGVITTDIVNPVYSGRLVGSPAYIDADTPSASAELAEAIAVGTEDMGDESGLAAVELALSEPVMSTENAGFIRPDARLAVVFLSDEPEQSAYDSAHYISFLQSVKADPNDIIVSGIVGDAGVGCTSTCADEAQEAREGDKYLEVIAAFDGVAGSICTCDLTTILDQIGMETTRYIRSFILTEVPTDPTQIQVWVNGELEPAEAWSYSEATNEILFVSPPLNESEIVAVYPAALTCE